MNKSYQKTNVAFAEVTSVNNISYHQNRCINNNDNRLMIYFQGVKLYIPDGFHQETLLQTLQILKQL